MGLDMYLYASKYFNNGSYKAPEDPEKRAAQTIAAAAGFNPSVESITVKARVAYWRKANAVHKWFVDNVQDGTDDCGEYRVSIGHLKELRDTAKQVLDEYREWLAIPEDERDNEEPFEFGDRLPTQAGFFFGGTDYDEWYVRDLEITIEQLDRILAEHASHGDWIDYIYQSSW